MLAPGVPARRAWLARAERWALPAILLLAFAVRVFRLGDKNIWWDEGISVFVARKSFLEATLWTARDTSPPAYYWSLWGWVRLAGQSEFAARFISAAWGVLTVAVAYALGSRVGGRRVGLLAALFLAVARFHVWWSQEMRMHILAPLMATLVLYAAARWLEEARERPALGWGVLYALAAAGCLYTLYLAALAPLVANIYALVAFRRIPHQRRLAAALRWLGAQAAALLLFLPWLLFALGHMRTWSVAEPFSARLLVTLYSTLLTVGISTDIERYVIYALPFAATLAGGLATLLWRRKHEPGLPGGQAALLLALSVAAMPLAVYAMTQPRSLFYTPRVEARYFLLFAPAFSVFLAWSVLRLGRRLWPLGLAAGAACLGIMLAFLPGYYEGRYLRDDLQTMVRIVGAYSQPGDAILLVSGDRYPLFLYYYERDVPPERRVPVLQLPQTSTFTSDNAGPQLSAATAGHSRFWLASVEPAIQDPNGLSLPWLDKRYTRLLTHEMGRNALVLYGDQGAALQLDPGQVAPEWPLSVQEGGVQLLGYDLPVRECRAGDTVDLGVYEVGEGPVQAEVQWLHDDGAVLQSVSQAWPATAPAAARAPFRFTVAPTYRAGATHFLLRWWEGDEASAHSVELPGPHILPAPPGLTGEIAQPLDVAFEQGIRLRGYDLHRPSEAGVVEAQAGEALTLDLFWEASGPVAQSYTVFTHLLGLTHNPRTGGPVWAQHDGEPAGGKYPTQAWPAGELIPDRHVLTIDPATPPGDYELEVGLYLPSTLERLRIAESGEDRVVVARVRIK